MGSKMNPLSTCILYVTHIIAAVLDLLPPPLATTMSAFMIGNLFGIAVRHRHITSRRAMRGM